MTMPQHDPEEYVAYHVNGITTIHIREHYYFVVVFHGVFGPVMGLQLWSCPRDALLYGLISKAEQGLLPFAKRDISVYDEWGRQWQAILLRNKSTKTILRGPDSPDMARAIYDKAKRRKHYAKPGHEGPEWGPTGNYPDLRS